MIYDEDDNNINFDSNIDNYTDRDIFDILDILQPINYIELETKILSHINLSTDDNDIERYNFFKNMYHRFFEDDDDIDGYNNEFIKEEEEEETNESIKEEGYTNEYEDNQNKDEINNKIEEGYGNEKDNSKQNNTNYTTTYEPTITGLKSTNTPYNGKEVLITNPREYTIGPINPLLTETISRTICLDSSKRTNKNSISTDYVLTLSETLQNVVQIILYSIQIPYVWYTISNTFGTNFLFITGSSIGLENDIFKILIDPGNYTELNLISEINNQIKIMKNTYTDISFGNTAISYNTTSTLTKFTVDIQKVYNESNYKLQINNDASNNFPYPDPDLSNNIRRSTSLSSYLGFNIPIYDTQVVYSDIFFLPNNELDKINNTLILDGSNNILIINQYNTFNDTEQFTPLLIDTITITLPMGNYTQFNLFNLINTALQNHPKLSTNSNISIVTYNKSHKHNYSTSSSLLYSSFMWNIQLNRYTTQNIIGSKLELVIPNDNKVWTNKNGLCFGPSGSDANITLPLSIIMAESALRSSNYDLSNRISSISLKCNNDWYNYNTVNDISGTLASSIYTLDQYLTEITTSLHKMSKYVMESNTSATIINDIFTLNLDITRVFTTKDYIITIPADSFLHTKLNIVDKSYNTEFNSIDISATSVLSSYTINNSNNRIFIITRKNNESGIDPSFNVVVKILENQYNVVQLFEAINNAFQFNEYQLYQQSLPVPHSICTNSYATVKTDPVDSNKIITTISINITDSITQIDYTLKITETDISGTDISKTDTSWYKDLGLLSTEYDLSNVLYNRDSYAVITGKSIQLDTLTLDTDAEISFIPINNDIKKCGNTTITIPKNIYSRNGLINKINELFSENPITKGTFMAYKTSVLQLAYTTINININKVFVTQDYNLVFFDTKFISCFVGNSSIRNATYDTTLGWMLGYHGSETMIYNLSPNNIYTNTTTNTTYYQNTNNKFTYDTSTNICTLFGDVPLNITTYNSFLIILDEYCPNRINDGLVTITGLDNQLSLPSYANRTSYICDPITHKKTNVGISTNTVSNKLTQNQIYSINQIINGQNTQKALINDGTYVDNLFGVLPLNIKVSAGQTIVENGGSLMLQERKYNGPVNIGRMRVTLISDKGDIVDLNGCNWSMQLIVKQLYLNIVDEPNIL